MSIFNKRNTFLTGMAAASALLAASCAKQSTTDTSIDNKEYFDAWMSVNHPGLQKSGLGIYLLEDYPGAGESISEDDIFVFIDYVCTDLEGNVSGTTYENVAKQVGTYSASNYYGSALVMNDRTYTPVGVLEMLDGMRIGGTRKAVIPGWLNVTKNLETEEDYIKNGNGGNVIYTITLRDKTENIIDWQIDSLERYSKAFLNGVDSTKYGYYYQTLTEPSSPESYSADSTFYINYTGRLLNGMVFDTTVEDTAKVYGIWSSSKKYVPWKVKMDSDYKEITIKSSDSSDDGTTTVEGFSFCLSNMRPYEKGRCIFYSELGYGYSGKGSIPKYSPLIFDIEVVDKPE